MTCLIHKYRSDTFSLSQLRILKVTSGPKVDEFDNSLVSFICKEKVLWLNVPFLIEILPVHEMVLMEVVHCWYDLVKVEAGINFGETFVIHDSV